MAFPGNPLRRSRSQMIFNIEASKWLEILPDIMSVDQLVTSESDAFSAYFLIFGLPDILSLLVRGTGVVGEQSLEVVVVGSMGEGITKSFIASFRTEPACSLHIADFSPI